MINNILQKSIKITQLLSRNFKEIETNKFDKNNKRFEKKIIAIRENSKKTIYLIKKNRVFVNKSDLLSIEIDIVELRTKKEVR